METMHGNGLAELGVPRLLESTSNLYKTLEEQRRFGYGVSLGTPKELLDEVAVWMNLLERIGQVQISGSGMDMDSKVQERQNLCNRYATTLFDINRHLEISQTSTDPEKAALAREGLWALRQMLQQQRSEVERWLADAARAAPAPSDGNAVQHSFLAPQPMDLHIGAILRDAQRVQLNSTWQDTRPTRPTLQHNAHSQQPWNNGQVPTGQQPEVAPPAPAWYDIPWVPEQQPQDALTAGQNVQAAPVDVSPQAMHAQMMEKIKAIATGIEEMGLHLGNLNKPYPSAEESSQNRAHLTTRFDHTKEDFWMFLQEFYDLGSHISNDADKNAGITGRPDLTLSRIQSIEIIPHKEQSKKDQPKARSEHPEPAASGKTRTPIDPSAFETFLTALPENFVTSPTGSDRENDDPMQKHPSYIGSDAMSKSIIEKDTKNVTKHFSQIIGGSFKKTGLDLGAVEVRGSDWVSQFCDSHRYLNGVLMAVTLPKELFLWHMRHFSVDAETWTKGALIRTLSILTEQPRYLHSYPLRHGRNLPLGKPNLLLHWNLEDIREPYVSARFKELVQVGSELQHRVNTFSYKQMVVCITIPWWICYKDNSGDRKQALEFLERMGILGAIPINEKHENGIKETLWCPSRIKVGESEKSVHAFVQEMVFTGSPELEPAIAATPTRFVVVTVRRGHVDDWADAVQCALGMSNKSLRYSVSTEEAISFSQLNTFYRRGRGSEPETSK